tara:strand:+ start:657 stop:2279 length:1623 start_codon:yes stop_codon:yes gene_type:complete
MPSPPNTTNITPPRVPFLDAKSGLISREWYRFLLNLFTITGTGTGVTPVINGGTGVSTIPANGELLIGNGTGYTVHTLNNGQNITVTNGEGTIEIALSGIVPIANGGTATSDVPGVGELLIGDGTSYQVQNLTSGQNILITNGAGSIAIALTGIVPIANGGTNSTATPTAGAVPYGTGTAYGFTAAGTSGQVLTSAGAGTPTWTTPTTGTVTSVGVSGGTTGLTTSGGPITSSGTVTLAGTLTAGNGGTGLTTYTAGDLSYYASGTALSKLSIGAANTVLTSSGTAPQWSTGLTLAGRVITGGATTSDATTYTANTVFQISSVTGTNATANFICWSATTTVPPQLQFNKSNSGVIGTRGVVASGDALGYYTFSGDNGTSFVRAAQIGVFVDGAVAAGSMPGRIIFYTSASGSVSPTERMRIDSAGNVGIGRTATTTLDVNGSIAFRAPSLTNAATLTVATTDVSLRFTTTACTVTLPAAASFTGRVLYLNNVTAIAVTSASSNVVPLGSNTAGTAILAATAGKFAMIQSDGTNWITMMAN